MGKMNFCIMRKQRHRSAQINEPRASNRDIEIGKILGLTIAGQNDYCNTITIVNNPIAILLLFQLHIAILLH